MLVLSGTWAHLPGGLVASAAGVVASKDPKLTEPRLFQNSAKR